MDLLCPNCDSTLTPSAVGYLCVDCGAVHKFYRTPDGTPIDPSVKRKVDGPRIDSGSGASQLAGHRHNAQPHHTPIDHSSSATYKRRLRHRLKQLIVPELPSPLEHEEISQQNNHDAPAPHDIVSQPEPTKVEPAANQAQTPSIGGTNLPAETNTPLASIPAQQPNKFNSKKILIIGGLVLLFFAGLTIFGAVSRRQAAQPAVSPSLTPTPQASTPAASDEAVSRDTQRKKDLKEISTALEIYKQEKGAYPVGTDISAVYPLQYANPPYIKYVNYDPLSNDAEKIKYLYESNGTTFTIKAKLENSKDTEAKNGYYIVSGT